MLGSRWLLVLILALGVRALVPRRAPSSRSFQLGRLRMSDVELSSPELGTAEEEAAKERKVVMKKVKVRKKVKKEDSEETTTGTLQNNNLRLRMPEWNKLDGWDKIMILTGVLFVVRTVRRTLARVLKREPNWEAADTSNIENLEEVLQAFRCEECGFTIYPALGREGKFFPKGFTCPNCGAAQESFYDLNDENDPRNQEDAEVGTAKQ